VRQAKEDQKRDALAWQAQHSKALQLAQATGTDVKALTQSAEASLAKARQQEETRARNRASVNDHYNPEGQHRHYERNLKALPRDLERSQVTDTYNPILQQSNNSQDEKEGARRLAKELHRRIEKQKKKRDRVEFEAEDVTFIDKRNKMFNKKLARTYDKATAEIRQNLERGTAL
jgi:pre-mRNA-splicing factor SYF2